MTETYDSAKVFEKVMLELQAVGGENFDKWFSGKNQFIEDQKVVVFEISHLEPHERALLIGWIKQQADREEAIVKLKALMPQIKFDIEAAELGALPPGQA